MTSGALVPAYSCLTHWVGITASWFCLFTDAGGTTELIVDDNSRVGRLPVSVTLDDVAV
ncbi:MAG: hypothetical protein V5A38_03545 [Halolamina sp.]|uniref:hypothetical protein n=1 Tax=Halolamina sp. TaxID=1940283 RepID=UPI002FC2C55B